MIIRSSLRVKVFSLFLLLMVLVSSFSALAAKNGADAKAADYVGSILNVSQALTSFMNNSDYVNSNTANTGILAFVGDGPSRKPGIMGGLLGVIDRNGAGIYGGIISPETYSSSASSYDAWYNVGSNYGAYVYTRFGRMMADLGLDSVGTTNGGNAGRFLFGGYTLIAYRLGAFVPQLFNTVLAGLKLLNPFDYLVRADLPSEGGVIGKSFIKVVEFFRSFYNGLRDIGSTFVLPITLVFLLVSVLLLKKSPGSQFLNWLKRAFFIVIGVPVLAALYTSVLNDLDDTILARSATSKLIVSSFSNFQGLVVKGRLDLPSSVSLISVWDGDDDESLSKAGSASSYSIASLRRNTAAINAYTGAVSINFGGFEDELTADLWNSDGVVKSASADSQKDVTRISGLLTSYFSNAFYHGASWATAVQGAMPPAKMGSAVTGGNAVSNNDTVQQMYADTDAVDDWAKRDASDNMAIFGAGSGTGSAVAWATDGEINIFSNANSGWGAKDVSGLDLNNLKFSGGGPSNSSGTAYAPGSRGALSSLAMYNYLCTNFDPSNIVVYSLADSTSEFTQKAHHSVNLIGSGALHYAYGLNVGAALFALVIMGYMYAVGMFIGTIKRSWQLIVALPGAMLGFFKSIMQVVSYFIVMLFEVLLTFAIYNVVSDLIFAVVMLVENIIAPGGLNSSGSGNGVSAGGGVFQFTSVIGYTLGSGSTLGSRVLLTVAVFLSGVLVFWIARNLIKHNRSLLICYEYCMCKLWRIFTFKEFVPVFDMYFANRDNLYVWSNVAFDFKSFVSDVCSVLTSSEFGVIQVEGG